MCLFLSAELQCEKHNNPADFYLDKIIRSEEQVKDAQNAVTEEGKGVCVCLSVCVSVCM